MLLTYQYFSFESVHGEAMLKMGWVVKKWNFSFWTAINWSKCILMVSVHIWLSIYTNNAILCIIWNFDLSSRGVLGRIYALSIEVLCFFKLNSKGKIFRWVGCFFHFSFLSLSCICPSSEGHSITHAFLKGKLGIHTLTESKIFVFVHNFFICQLIFFFKFCHLLYNKTC